MPVFASGGSRNLLKKGFLRIFQNFLVRFAGRSGHSLTFIGSKHQGSSLTGSSNINNISFFASINLQVMLKIGLRRLKKPFEKGFLENLPKLLSALRGALRPQPDIH